MTRALRDVANPRWGLAYWRARRARIPTESRAQFWFEEHAESLHDVPGALAAVTGTAATECRRIVDSVWLPDPVVDDVAVWWPREILMRLVSAVTRLTRPTTVIEVGVARGYTSAAILGALAANGDEGRLHSIDLPPREEDPDEFVGKVIPANLRERWQLSLGPSRSELPELLSWVDDVDLFVHDGDHSYESQREDLETVWPHLSAGAVVVVDDIWTPAIFNFAEDHGEHVVIAEWAEHTDGVGLLRKSGP